MYVRIDSKDAQNENSSGKSSVCYCSDPKVKNTTKWRDKRRIIAITGHFSDTVSSGKRGGIPLKINRSFEVWLEEDDLKEIILQALRGGLVCFPGEKQILEAKKLLENILTP